MEGSGLLLLPTCKENVTCAANQLANQSDLTKGMLLTATQRTAFCTYNILCKYCRVGFLCLCYDAVGTLSAIPLSFGDGLSNGTELLKEMEGQETVLPALNLPCCNLDKGPWFQPSEGLIYKFLLWLGKVTLCGWKSYPSPEPALGHPALCLIKCMCKNHIT